MHIMDLVSVTAILMAMAERVIHPDHTQDVRLLKKIQDEVARLVSEHDSPVFTACARRVWTCPGVLLTSFLESDTHHLHKAIGDEPFRMSEETPALHPEQESLLIETPEPHHSEKRRRRMKRMLANNILDSFF